MASLNKIFIILGIVELPQANDDREAAARKELIALREELSQAHRAQQTAQEALETSQSNLLVKDKMLEDQNEVIKGTLCCSSLPLALN